MIAGWGRAVLVDAPLIEAGTRREVAALVGGHRALIPRGNGRAYGDAALSREAMLVQPRADHILAFDPVAGEIEVEAGLLLCDLLPFLLARGFFVPVTPGTAAVSIGGMAAADVHGKNHHGAGSFGRHILRLTLVMADGSVADARPGDELFATAVGGMGLVGVIVAVRFRLIRVAGGMMRQSSRRTGDLAETIAVSKEARDAPYHVAWIDGAAGGRGVVYSGDHADAATVPERPRPRAVPGLAAIGLHRWSAALFNRAYHWAAREGEAEIDVWRFFYQLDALQGWNRLYGKQGFHQFQCVLPGEAAEAGLRLLLEATARDGFAPYLGVLKLCGEAGPGMLSFPLPGWSLALDFPASPEVRALLGRLEAITIDHGGRLYLAKDALAGPASLRHYPELERFRAGRARFDPERRFTSLLSERLGL